MTGFVRRTWDLVGWSGVLYISRMGTFVVLVGLDVMKLNRLGLRAWGSLTFRGRFLVRNQTVGDVASPLRMLYLWL